MTSRCPVMSLGRGAHLLRWSVAIIVFVVVVFSAPLQRWEITMCGFTIVVVVAPDDAEDSDDLLL